MKRNIIILSGLPGSGKSTLAKELSKIYNWPIYSVGDKCRGEWKKLYPNSEISFEDYRKNASLEDNLIKHQQAREAIERGQIIGDTRYTIYCVDLSALFVFIFANLDIRIQRGLNTAKYKNKTYEEIKKNLIERENHEVNLGKMLYGEEYDYRDLKNYHLMLNTDILTIDEEISIIRGIL